MHWASFGLVQRPPAALPVGMLWGDVLGPISSRADAQCQRMIEVQINDKLARGAHASQPSDSDVLHGTTAAGSASKLSKRKTSLMNTVQHVFCSAGSFWTRSRDIQLSLVGEERHLKGIVMLPLSSAKTSTLTSSLDWGDFIILFTSVNRHVFSGVWPFVNPWTVAHQAPLSMRFSKQEYWSGLPFPSPGDLPDPGIKITSLMSPSLAGRFFSTSTAWKTLSEHVSYLLLHKPDYYNRKQSLVMGDMEPLLVFNISQVLVLYRGDRIWLWGRNL